MSNGAHHPLIGRTLGNRYVVQRVLGTGAMGTVYSARQTELGTSVAIKVLHPRLANDPGLVQRFEREAFATSRLDHPNALRVLDFGQDGDLLYLVTEYVEAEDLLTIMEAEWPLSDARVVSILSQVLSALTAVHNVGIVHRDLKPENILVLADQDDDGARIDVVKVCDFGIAKMSRPNLQPARPFARRLTAAGVVVGTPDYMSPEQARGQPVDGRSDLYSLGVVLYQLLAGRTPFDADSAVAIALLHVSEPPVPPSRYREVHRGLEAVCLRALSKRPEERFQTARDMRQALRAALAADPNEAALVRAPVTSIRIGSTFSTSSPASRSLRSRPPALAHTRVGENERRRRRMSVGYAAIVSVVTITTSAFVARRSSTADPAATPPGAQAAMGLVSPPHLAPAPGSTPERASMPNEVDANPERSIAVVETAEPATAEIEPERRLAARARPTNAIRSEPHSIVVAVAPPASPVASTAPTAASPVLVRSDPWTRQADAREPPASAPLTVLLPDPPRTPPTGEPRLAPSARPQMTPSVSSGAPRPSVSFSGVVTSAGISGAKVKVALSHVPLVGCYQQALRAHRSDASLDTELRLTVDIGGRVVQAALSRDGNHPGLRSCIESSARGVQIRDVDTGDGTATVQLRFSPR